MGTGGTAAWPAKARWLVQPDFRHEALLYDGNVGFVDAVVPFARAALAAREPLMVMVESAKIDLLRAALGPDAGAVSFSDMTAVGRNPACIIPAWRDFVTAHAGSGRVRGIGEPAWPGRTSDELRECWRHEALLNVAFATAPPFWLLCPYDRDALDPGVITGARRNHPVVVHGDGSRHPTGCPSDWPAEEFHRGTLPEPPPQHVWLPVLPGGLGDLRAVVREYGLARGFAAERIADFVLAVDEAAANSLMHAGGAGDLRLWYTGEKLICEVRDQGVVTDPLAGRERAPAASERGRGLWIVHQLCDLVQVRSCASGTAVRMHLRRTGDV